MYILSQRTYFCKLRSASLLCLLRKDYLCDKYILCFKRLKIFIAMDIIKRTVTANSNKLITTNGEAAPSLISSAWNLSDINEDIVLTDQNGQEVPFIIVPLSEGTIKVILTGGMEYTISEAEVSANLGSPLMYMVQKILKEGTTATNLSIGF